MRAIFSWRSASDRRTLHFGSALAGGCIWLLAMPLLLPGWAPVLLLLAPLALVPLALALVTPQRNGRPLLWQAAAWLPLPCALVLLAAFAVPAGPLAGLLSLPWFGFTLLVGCLGLLRLRPREHWALEELSGSASLVFLAVGGMWTSLSRGGIRPMGFDEPIVLLTGAHFHYAGLVLPLLTGLAGRELRGTTSRLAAAGVLAGVPAVALGINLSALGVRWVEWLAACLLAAFSILAALLQLRLARRAAGALVRALLLVCGLSLLTGMALAALYATGTYWGQDWLSIPVMIQTHGVINALGFALPGLLAWNRMRK